MIYETLQNSNSDSKDKSESENPIDHYPECNGSGTVDVLCQECEDTGRVYEASTTSNANSKANSEEANQTKPGTAQIATEAEQWATFVMCATLHI